MKPKTCLECAHFYFDGGSPHYSDMTPGSNMEIRCLKKVWSLDYDASEEFREKMATAW